jgi:histidinol-phosphatase
MRADPDVALAAETARLAVEAASAAALRHFRTDLEITIKDDRSPVTQADRDAEAAILDVIRRVFPEHATLAEESGAAGAGRDRWIVDPLDGTRGFSRGGSFWGPLVAYERDGRVLAGAMALPALRETYWAGRGLGAFRDGERLRVSSVARWEDATLSLGEMRYLLSPPYEEGVRALVASASSTRCYGDLAGAAMLLQGKADAWIEAGVRPWDLGPIAILVEEAGGRFTDLGGNDAALGDHAIATNGALHAHVLAALRAGR